MKSLLFCISIFFLFTSTACNPTNSSPEETTQKTVEESAVTPEKKSDKFYHYSIWYAFVNKIFEGKLTVKELKTQGDIGLGSYNRLDGELIMLDGELYQATQDGKVTIPEDDKKIVYANATFFDNDKSFEIKEAVNYNAEFQYQKK